MLEKTKLYTDPNIIPNTIRIVSVAYSLDHTFIPLPDNYHCTIEKLIKLSEGDVIDQMKVYLNTDAGAYVVANKEQIPIQGWIDLKNFCI